MRYRDLLSGCFGVLLLLILGGCDEPPAASAEDKGAAALRTTIAMAPDARLDVQSILFSATSRSSGATESSIVPLHPEPLPDTASAELAGHVFADWLVALEPGDYRVTMEPLRSVGGETAMSSRFCEAVRAEATVLPGQTTEIILVSNCTVHGGGLDVIGVLNSSPVLLSLEVDPNKFFCSDETATLSADAVDPEGSDVFYAWRVSVAPDGVDETGHALTPRAGMPHVADFKASEPGRYEIKLQLSDGSATTSVVFPVYVLACEREGSIHGTKWLDVDGDGTRDDGEPGLPGVVIYIDVNDNARLDQGEPRTQTMRDVRVTDFDESGLYWLSELPAGDHVVREVVPDGFLQTFPDADGSHRVLLRAGSVLEGIDFGNSRRRNGAVHGAKWRDDNGNGERDRNEPGVAGVMVYADANGNGELDDGEPRTRTMADDPNTALDETGRYWLEDLTPGTWTIREVVPDGFQQTFPGVVPPADTGTDNSFATVDPLRLDASLESGEVLSTSVSITVHPLCFRPFEIDLVSTDSALGLINSTGIVINGCGGDKTIFDIQLTGDGNAHDFELQFVDAEFGGVLAVLPVSITVSAAQGAHTVVIHHGTVIEAVDFGNQPIPGGSVHGIKWHDDDGDGRRGPGEPGLAGVTVYSDLNSNGELDRNDPHTLTMRDDPDTAVDEAGRYWLEDLRPGTHLIREVVPDGFVQTFPLRTPLPGADDTGNTLATADPIRLDATLENGEVLATSVAITIHPLCVRPFEIDVVANDPAAAVVNDTGVLINGCGGDVSSFDIRITGDGGVRDFDLQFVDLESGSVLASLPVSITASGAEGAHRVVIENNSVVENVNFGNRARTGR